MDAEAKRLIKAALDAHDDAFRALREANQTISPLIQAHEDAIHAALAANHAVIDLLEHLGSTDQPGT